MNLNGIIHSEDISDRSVRLSQAFQLLRYGLGHLLNLAGVAVFWLYMIALLVSPLWVPLLVNTVLGH